MNIGLSYDYKNAQCTSVNSHCPLCKNKIFVLVSL